MAAEAPICDVLCEAMEYLSKLGNNLKARTENLKERKIRKEKLRNAHAVQKAINKVLLICELSKKSLENVEIEVNKIRKRVDCSQAPFDIGGKNDKKCYTFPYRSKTLKIATKIPIKHYMSMKVHARKMSTEMQDKYPVYYNCKLYRQRKRLEKAKSENEKKKFESSPEKLIEHNDKHEDCMQEQEYNPQLNDTDKLSDRRCEDQNDNETNTTNVPEDQGEEVQVNTSSLEDESNGKEIEKDQSVPSAEQQTHARDENDKEIKNMTKIDTNDKKDIDSENVRCKSTKKHVSVVVDSSSENDANSLEVIKNDEGDVELNEKNVDDVIKPPQHKKRKIPLIFESESDCEPTEEPIDSNNEKKNNKENCQTKTDGEGKISEKHSDTEKEPIAVDSDTKKTKENCEPKLDVEPPKPLIKCVSISKLLKPDVIKSQETLAKKQLFIESERNSILKENKHSSLTKSTVRYRSIGKSRKVLKNKQTEVFNQSVNSFQPKEFKISLSRLPTFNDDLLNLHKIKIISQGGSVVYALSNVTKNINNDDINNVKKALLNDSDTEDSRNVENNLGQSDNEIQNNDTGQSEKNLDIGEKDSNDSVSLQIASPINPNSPEIDQTEEVKTSKENENIKSSLLNDTDSDQNEKSAKSQKNAVDGISESNSKEREENIKETGEAQSNKNGNNEDNSPTKIKQALLNSSEDSDKSDIVKHKQKIKNKIQSSRKRMMQSMEAKKMLLTYSSSSEDEGTQRHKLKYESSDSDVKKHKHKRKRKKSCLSSSSDKMKNQSGKHSDSKDEYSTKEITASNDEESSKRKANNSEHSDSNSGKMVRSKAKPGSSISNNSDTQDLNDKDVDRLTNLNNMDKPRRRHSSGSDNTDDVSRSTASKKGSNTKTSTLGEHILKEESSSEAPSADENDSIGAEEEYPPQIPMDLNNGIGHLSKDDLLGDSDSSLSNEKDKNSENATMDESEEENMKLKRRKAIAISSGSEAGSSRKKGRNRNDRSERLSDFEDSEDENSEPGKKNKRRKGSESDASGSTDDGSKKKRRRIKQMNDSDISDSDGETEGRNKHGRKNIRKVMGKNQLEEATKKAAREEKERIARIAERQKLYNNLEFDESGKPDEVVLEKVVLDFDPETKEPLIEVDRGLVKKLKPHQANGIKFMWDACFESVKRIKKGKGSGCILAHCMGLGKTLQVVSLTHTLLTHGSLTGVRRVLVVCPLSTVLNWVNEFRMWLKHAHNDFEVDVYELSRHKQNSERAFQLGQWFECGGVCVLGYEMFRNLSADNAKKFKKKMLKTFQESLVDPGPDLVVCDEGHLLKNEKTSLSQSMNRVKTLRRIVLTGTPLQNNLKEYYCMVQFVKPNLLGKYNEYLNRFVNPITNGQYTDSTEHDIRVMKRRSHVLHKMLDGAVQRRDYGVLAPFLPPKHEYVLFITLSEVQIKLYQYYLDNYSRRPSPGKSSGFLFPDFQSLQRIWTHPLVLKYNSERYEIMQQKKRDREEEEDSEGSLVDFIDDDSTPEATSTEESSDDSSVMSDDSGKKNKKKKTAKKGKVKDSKPRRGTRANPVEHEEEEPEVEMVEEKNENPTEWWIKMVTDDEIEDMRNSHKLVLLFDILRQCDTIGDKLLVFSQSLYSLDLIEHFLGKVDEATQEGRIDEKLGGHVGSWSPGVDYFRLDGSTSCENRSIWCKNFNREDNPRARLFLISTRAGGLGINLVAANRVVIFDVSWNPSHDVQSIFRVYRFGQKKPCYIYRFLAMGTMEEKIYERQVTKQAISKRVIDEQQIDRHYAENDLAELYQFEPNPPQPRELPALPKDRLFAEMLREHEAQIYKYHEHDSLLENKEEETLTEEERKAAWEDFENEKNKPPPAPFPTTWPMHNGMVPGLLAQQQQQLAYAALAAMLRKDMPNINDNQIRDMAALVYNSNPGLMQKMGDIYKYAQPGMMNPAMMNPAMNAAGSGSGMGSGGLQYEPPWQRQHQHQQQMRLQQLLQQQNHMGAKYYAGGLGSRDPVAMALQQQRAREIMLGGGGGGGGVPGGVAGAAAGGVPGGAGRPRGRPPLQPRAPSATAQQDIVNLDSD